MQLAPKLDGVPDRQAALPLTFDAQPTWLQRAEGQGGTGRPIKVCFISPLGYGLYRPESRLPFGGAEVQFSLLARSLSQDRDFSVSVLTTVDVPPSLERQGALTLITRRGQRRLAAGQGITWFRPFKALRDYGTAFLDMLKELRGIDADLYLHTGAGVEVGAYALICRLLRRRFLYVVASSADLCEPYGKVEGPLKWLYPLGLRLADAVVCRTNEQLADLRRRYGRDGVLIRSGHPVPTSPHVSRLTPHAILWVGRGHPLKQPELFLDLAKQLPQERCVMVLMRDPAHEHLLTAIRTKAVSLPNLTLKEDLPLSEVDRLMEQAKLFVNTSTYEGFPNTFVQAAMQGVPILSWSVDPDGVLAEQKIGFCASGSFDRLVEAAEDLCASESGLAELGRRALAYAREHHDLVRSVEELKALLRSLDVPRTGVTTNQEAAR